MPIRSKVTPVVFLLLSRMAAAGDSANVPIATEKGPTGHATVSVGVGNSGPQSISVGGERGGYSGGVSVGTNGGVSVSGGFQSGGTSVSGTVSHDPSGNASATAGASTTFP